MLDRRLALWLWNCVQKTVMLAVEWRKLSSSAHLGNQLQLWQSRGRESRWTGTVTVTCVYARVTHALRSSDSHPPWVECVLLSGSFCQWSCVSSALARLAGWLVLVTKVMQLWKFIQYQHGLRTWRKSGHVGFRWTLSQLGKGMLFEEQERGSALNGQK